MLVVVQWQCVCECHSSLSMCSAAVASKQCVLKSYRGSSLQLLLPLSLRELWKLGPIQQQVCACTYVGAWARVGGCGWVCIPSAVWLTVDLRQT